MMRTCSDRAANLTVVQIMTDRGSSSRMLKSLVLAVLALPGIASKAADRNVLFIVVDDLRGNCLLYTSPSPRD